MVFSERLRKIKTTKNSGDKMTVKELRDFISKLPNDATVKITEDDCEYPIKEIGYAILMSKDGKTVKTLSIEI